MGVDARRGRAAGPAAWRTWLALLLAPATLVLLVGWENADHILSHSSARTELFNADLLRAYVAICYAVSAIAALLVLLLRKIAGWPRAAVVVVPAFAAAFGLTGLVVNAPVADRLMWSGVSALASLPVSIAYCLIAGVPWRTRPPV